MCAVTAVELTCSCDCFKTPENSPIDSYRRYGSISKVGLLGDGSNQCRKKSHGSATPEERLLE